MALTVGGTPVKSVYVGGAPVTAVYVGSEKIWPTSEVHEVSLTDVMGMRAVHLFQDRPLLGVAAALAGGFIFLRNPALATMVAAAFTEKSRQRRR